MGFIIFYPKLAKDSRLVSLLKATRFAHIAALWPGACWKIGDPGGYLWLEIRTGWVTCLQLFVGYVLCSIPSAVHKPNWLIQWAWSDLGSWAKVLMSPSWWESAATWPHLWSRRLADHRRRNGRLIEVPLQGAASRSLSISISTNVIPWQSLMLVCVCLCCWIGAAAKLAFSVCIYSCNFDLLAKSSVCQSIFCGNHGIEEKISKFLMNTPQTTWSVQPSHVWAGVWWTDTFHPAPGEHRAELHVCLQKLLCLQGQGKK